MKKNQKGFSVFEVIIAVVVLGALVFVGIAVASKLNKDKDGTTANQSPAEGDTQVKGSIWRQTAAGWEAQGKAPACPAQPMLKAPADLGKVTSVLYPGQTRGSYKPHGGLRFDNSTDNKVTVVSPIEGHIVKATRNFAEGTTEVQYGFDIMHNCGVMIRMGHLRQLPDNLQQIVNKLPEPSADSRIENVNPAVYVKQGDVLATMVGITADKNTFFDWGVYDYRQENEASTSPAYKAAHPQGEHAWHAVCWVKGGWLPSQDQNVLAPLNDDNPASKMSDYCKQ